MGIIIVLIILFMLLIFDRNSSLLYDNDLENKYSIKDIKKELNKEIDKQNNREEISLRLFIERFSQYTWYELLSGDKILFATHYPYELLDYLKEKRYLEKI